MNYPTFLKEVDRLVCACDADDLRKFVHEMARTVPESDRQSYLSTLSRFCSGSVEKTTKTAETEVSLADQIDRLLKAMEEIQEGEREIECEYNEEWDDWHDEERDEYNFSDPDHVLDDIAAGVRALHQCVDQEEYAKGAELAKALSELKVHVSGDFEDDEMNITGLVMYDLLNIDQKKAIKEALYLGFMGTREPERAEATLEMMDYFEDYSVSLEELLQTGPEEIDLDSMLPSWIEALAKRPASRTDRLLLEAQEMLQDQEAALENASRYAQSHPVLYSHILHGKGNVAPEEMLQIGLRAMKEVPVNLLTRCTISLLTAKYALESHQRRTAEECWLEAFRTLPTVENYLRLRLQSQHWEEYATQARDIYTAYYQSRNTWEKTLPALMFFDERFEEMIEGFMKVKGGIGWSSTFMKEGIALLLMLMDSGKTTRQGMSVMLSKAISASSFHSDSYREGTDMEPGMSNVVLFQECFQKWKNEVVLEESTCDLWLNKIDNWLALRVAAIMDANRRKTYGECAAFIAAYGEVLESRGNSGEKDRVMLRYKAEYSRRRAFLEELRGFGMKK